MARKVSQRRMPTASPTRVNTAPSSPAPLSRSPINRGLATLFRMANADGGSCPKCEEKLQRSSGPGRDPNVAPPIVREVLRSPGRPLDDGVRTDMEQRFGGADFGGVRVHTDAKAADSAEAVNARAYTVGSSAVMGRGQSAQTGPLLAHELPHTPQSLASPSIPLRVAPNNHPSEVEAGRVAASVSGPSAGATPTLSRANGLFRTCAANPTEAFYRGAPNYCADTGFSGSLHPGQTCYREVPVRADYFDCPPGDQVCFDDDRNCHDSFDLVSTVESKDSDGSCNLHGYCFGGHAKDDIIPGLTDIALGPVREWYSDLDCSIRQLYGAPC